jgi:DNA mismatch repair protein MutS2
VDQAAAEQRQEHAALAAPVEEEEAPPAPTVIKGQWYYVPLFERDGIVMDILDEETAAVQIGRLRVETNIADLEPPREPASLTGADQAGRMKLRKLMTVTPEIDLRGTTVDEAILELEKYLDDAALAGLPSVRLLHGKGTGALREGVHKYLRRHRAVASYRVAELNDGGDGVTLVQMK